MGTVPEPPWTLGGEAVVALVWRTRLGTGLPAGVRRLPGPLLVVAERWATSPVGPYVSLAVGEPARLGLRAGVHFSTVVVSTTDSRAAGLALWGFPRQCGTLDWTATADTAEVVWEERGLTLRGRFRPRRLPVIAPVRALQARGDDKVVVPGRMRALARRGRVEIEVPGTDPLASLAGNRFSAHLGGLEMVLRAAAAPATLRARLRAPARGVEPGIP